MEQVSSFTWSDLPHELIVEVFSYLSVAQLRVARAVCRTWYQLAEDNSLWHPSWQQRHGPYAPLPRDLPSRTIQQLAYASSDELFDFFDLVRAAASGWIKKTYTNSRESSFYIKEDGSGIVQRNLHTGEEQLFITLKRKVLSLTASRGHLYAFSCGNKISHYNAGSKKERQNSPACNIHTHTWGLNPISIVTACDNQLLLTHNCPSGTQYQLFLYSQGKINSTILGTWSADWEDARITDAKVYLLLRDLLICCPKRNAQMGQAAVVCYIPKKGKGPSRLTLNNRTVTVLRPEGILYQFSTYSLTPLREIKKLSIPTPIYTLFAWRQRLFLLNETGAVFTIDPLRKEIKKVCAKGFDPEKKCFSRRLLQAVTYPPPSPQSTRICTLF